MASAVIGGAVALAGFSRRGRALNALRAHATALESDLRALRAEFGTIREEHQRAASALDAELRRADTVRREFVANVSHELRTPLASLKALAETLEEGALEDPPAARDFLAQMHVEVDSLTQLVQELLELSRIESGQAQLRPERVTPATLLQTAARRLRRQAERLGVTLEVQSDETLPVLHADPHLIERVLLNLIHNALKFTPSGGSVQLSGAPHPEGVCLTVQDTGSGIPPEELDRIFERFYKVDRSRASRGTGLGLAIAKHIVQAHRGRIWAESAGEGHGSAFRFTLPLE